MWNWWAETLVVIQTTPFYFFIWIKVTSQQQISMFYFVLITYNMLFCVGCCGTIVACKRHSKVTFATITVHLLWHSSGLCKAKTCTPFFLLPPHSPSPH